MDAKQSARAWMLLKSERSLGLKSIAWKGTLPGFESARPATLSAPATGRVVHAAPPARPVPPPIAPRPVSRPAPAPSTAPPAPTLLPQPIHPVKQLKMANEAELGGEEMPVEKRVTALKVLNETEVVGCPKCRLSETRTQTVFGEGDPQAKLFFIGEGPGEQEDQTGRPFVGRAGQLLTKMITAMGLTREQVFIANIVKCRPPGNRTPAPDEVDACTPYLVRQLQIIRPRVIVTLGLPATQYMLQTDKSMGSMRGVWHEWRGIKLMPTYHPSYVLRSYTPTVRGAVWSDLQKVMAELGLPLKGSM